MNRTVTQAHRRRGIAVTRAGHHAPVLVPFACENGAGGASHFRRSNGSIQTAIMEIDIRGAHVVTHPHGHPGGRIGSEEGLRTKRLHHGAGTAGGLQVHAGRLVDLASLAVVLGPVGGRKAAAVERGAHQRLLANRLAPVDQASPVGDARPWIVVVAVECVCRRETAGAVRHVDLECLPDAAQIGGALHRPGGVSRPRQRWKQNTDEHGNDGDDNQQFHQRKCTPASLACAARKEHGYATRDCSSSIIADSWNQPVLEIYFMPLSARNQFNGKVSSIKHGAVMSEVVIDIGGHEIVSLISVSSAKRLKLKKGSPAIAIIKATEVLVSTDIE